VDSAQRIEELETENAAFRVRVSELETENAAFRARVVELNEQVESLTQQLGG
jgi:predicted nuclease with TOPRIM domain